MGDPIEFDSIRKAFGGPGRSEKLHVGSIKDNIGHTETASGVAGLLKTVLMMQKQQIPKQANFVQLNPKIPALDDAEIAIPTKSIHWPSAATSSSNAVAMVTNYGAAGSNAALVVKQYKAPSEPSNRASLLPSEVPIILAANSVESLRSYCKVLLPSVRNAQLGSCQDIAYNLAVKQSRDMDYISTLTVPADQPNELIAKLESMSTETTNPKKQPSSRLPVILCFGGQNGNETTLSEDLFNQCELLQYHLVSLMNISLPHPFPGLWLLCHDSLLTVRLHLFRWNVKRFVELVTFQACSHVSFRLVQLKIRSAFIAFCSQSNTHQQCHGYLLDSKWTEL